MKLALRNQLAEWILSAVEREESERSISALLAFAEISDSEDLAAIHDHVARARKAVRICRKRCGPPPVLRRDRAPGARTVSPDPVEVAWTVCAAAALFNAGLYFEVHELLEPLWVAAEGDLRIFLQGLIQVAVGLHHRATGNPRGAVSLLRDGNVKLRPFRPRAWGVELVAFCAEVDRAEAALRERDAPRVVRMRLSAVPPRRAT